MIISDRYKYVFVEQPLTASTAIASELVRYYGGREILSKHSNYSDFLSVASKQERDYAVVIGARNPLDQVVSGYQKLKVNHSNAYDNPAAFEENGGWISKHRRKMFRYVHADGHEFEDYFRKYFGKPRVKVSQFLWSPSAYDFIIRFERLQQGFAEFLKFIRAEQVRELPVVNKTAGKRDFLSYYSSPAIRASAVYACGPLMTAWGYEIPPDWPERRMPARSKWQFRLVNLVARTVVNRIGMTPGQYRRLRARVSGGSSR
jgi:hypothetical protein